MAEYYVEWSIEIDADTKEEAAAKALQIQRDPSSTATVFTVINQLGDSCKIDLESVTL